MITPKVIIKFDKQQDIKNNWQTSNNHISWSNFASRLPSEIVAIVKDKSLKECQKEVERFYQPVYKSETLRVHQDAVQKAWNEIAPKYFKRLKKITKQPLSISPIKVYITTASRCPYNFTEKYFFINYFSSISESLKTIGHELLHFHFHEYDFESVAEKIGKERTHDLREALTVLLNLEFRDLWFVEDKGYEPHKELRAFIAERWNIYKSYQQLLEECVKKIREEVK